MTTDQEIDDRKLCLGCFQQEAPAEGPCPNCGFDIEAHDEPPMFLKPGTMLRERYIVGRILGKGGFGITYLGWDVIFHERVAVKEYMPSGLVTRMANVTTVVPHTGNNKQNFRDGLKLFLNEARNIKRFDKQSNIVGIMDFFEANSTGYMVMSFIDGPSISEKFRKKGRKATWNEAVQVIKPVLDALEILHAQNIYHRDISPQNILLRDGKEPIIIDFGASRQIVGEQSESLDVVLKPGYSPLEQYASRGEIGPWTDIYACAATMYNMLSGEIPPAAPDRLFKDEIIPPSDLKGVRVPAGADDCLLRALSVRAEDRFQTVEEFRDGLHKTGSAVPKTRGKGSRKFLLAALVILLAGLGAAAMLLPGGGDDAKPLVAGAATSGSDGGGKGAGTGGEGAGSGAAEQPGDLGGALACTPCLVQNVLAEQGDYLSILDGDFGRGSIKALKAFQEREGLPVDGDYTSAQTCARIKELSQGKKAVACGRGLRHPVTLEKLLAQGQAALKGERLDQAAKSLGIVAAGQEPQLAKAAREGLEAVGSQYASMALQAKMSGQSDKAYEFCQAALDAAPGHKGAQVIMKTLQGSMDVFSSPWAYLHVDGKALLDSEGNKVIAPVSGVVLPCGKHTVQFVNNDEADFGNPSVELTIKPGRTLHVRAQENEITIK